MQNVTLADRCVVDADVFYKIFVTVQTKQGADGKQAETVLGYKLKEGERLLDVQPPLIKVHAGSSGFVKPRWDSTAETWTEGATAEELAAWEVEHPAPEVPEPPEPSGDLEERVAALEQAQAEIWSAQAAAIREGVNSVD